MSDQSPLGILRRTHAGTILLWLVALTSLGLNLVMLNQLIALRRAAGQAVADAITVIDNLESQTFTTTVVVDNQLAVDTSIPVKETIPIQINQTLPIDTTVTVPVNAGLLGQLTLQVPIKAQIPVEIKQDVTIDQPFRVKTSVPLHLEVPVKIRLADTELAATLADIKARLLGLAGSLGAQAATPVATP